MNKKLLYRLILYFLGMVILALGLALNPKTSLGVSAIVSVAYSISCVYDLNFGNATLGLYVFFVVIEIIIHLARGMKKNALTDLLQILISVIFTRFLNLFTDRIPYLTSPEMAGTFFGSMPGRILVLCAAIILTGIGAALSMNMRIVPNPGDGIVQTIADATGKGTGFIKNCVDFTCVGFSCLFGLLAAGKIVGIGIGTVLAMIFVGRVIAVFNHFTKKYTDKLL